MSVFHVPSVCANANARAVDALERLCEHIGTFRTRPLVGEDFERVERELHEWFVEAEREVLGELLESLDVDVPSVEIGERRLHRVLNSTESYTTAVGPVKVARTLYRSGRERAVAPMELRAGIVEGHWTPLAARQASCVVAQMTPSEGEALLRELGNMAPSKSSLDRLPKALSARWEVSREAFESALREAAVVPDEAVTVAVSLDGVMVAMKDGKRADKRERSRAAGRRAKGPAGYQEAGCATLSFYDIEGERLDTLSIARMPEPKKATLKTMLGAELDTVLRRRPDLQVVTVADGAHDNWRYLDALAPEATAVVDFYHAAEQLKSALDARYGENDARGRAQFHKLRHVLLDDPDGVDKVIRALDYQRKKFPRRTRIGQVLRYFRRNRHRMRYADTQARHLPIGSGVVEAACKTLVTQRLKRSGMRWRRAGGQAILTLRALIHGCRKLTLRPSVGIALRDLSSRRHRPRQRGGVSLQTCRMTNQYQSYTQRNRAFSRESARGASRSCSSFRRKSAEIAVSGLQRRISGHWSRPLRVPAERLYVRRAPRPVVDQVMPPPRDGGRQRPDVQRPQRRARLALRRLDRVMKQGSAVRFPCSGFVANRPRAPDKSHCGFPIRADHP